MLNKKYLPSLGFLILLLTIIGSGLFIKWAMGPLSYEKAQQEETLGHQYAKDGKAAEAAKHFLNAAKIQDDNVSRSRRYRCAGSTTANEEQKIKYYKLALKYNPNNKIAIRELKPYLREIRYKNRYADGWSKGTSSVAIINTKEKNMKYKIVYFTDTPKKEKFSVNIQIDHKLMKQDKIQSHKPYSYDFLLSKGKHVINIAIDKTFNPKRLDMSADNRDLGIHYEIKKDEAK